MDNMTMEQAVEDKNAVKACWSADYDFLILLYIPNIPNNPSTNNIIPANIFQPIAFMSCWKKLLVS